MRARWLGAVLWLGCTEPKATTVSVNDGAYVVTLPPGWSSHEEAKSTLRVLNLTPPGDGWLIKSAGGACVMTFTPLVPPTTAAGFVRSFVESAPKSVGAKTSEPATLSTGFGEFEGCRFHGRYPVKSAVNALALLAGEISVGAFAGSEGSTLIGLQISTFGVSEHPERVRDGCERIARSLERAPPSQP